MRDTQSALKSVPAQAVEASCPMCGNKMRLAHIVPEKPGYDERTFQCLACGANVTKTIKS